MVINKSNSLSIVIPTLNEAENIKLLVPKIENNIKNKIHQYEIIIVDDCSEDNIDKVISSLKKKYKTINFIKRKNKNTRDLSKSCLLGFRIAKYENILVMDGDIQHNPKYILKLFKNLIDKKLDVVVGSRNLKKNGRRGLSLIRYFFSIIIIYLFNFFLGKKTTDPMSGFFVFKKKIINKVKCKLYGKGYKILSDIIYSNVKNFKIEDVNIQFNSRKKGSSKMNFKILLQLLFLFLNKLLN